MILHHNLVQDGMTDIPLTVSVRHILPAYPSPIPDDKTGFAFHLIQKQ